MKVGVKQEELEISSSNLSHNNLSVSNYDFLKNQLVKLNGNVVRRKFVILQNYSTDLHDEDLLKTATNIGLKFQEKFNECQIGFKKFDENQQFMIVIQLKSTCIGNTVISLLTQRLSSPIQINEENIYITEGQKSSRSTFHFKNIFGKNYQPLNFRNNNITKTTLQDLDLDSDQEIMEEEAHQNQQLLNQQIFSQQRQSNQLNQNLSCQQDQQNQQNINQTHNQQYQQTKNLNTNNSNINQNFLSQQQNLNQIQQFPTKQFNQLGQILNQNEGKQFNQDLGFLTEQFSQISLAQQMQSLEKTNQNTYKMVQQIFDIISQQSSLSQKVGSKVNITEKNGSSNLEEDSSGSYENVLMGQKKQKEKKNQESLNLNIERIDKKLDIMNETQNNIVTSNNNIVTILKNNFSDQGTKNVQNQNIVGNYQDSSINPKKTELQSQALELWIESELGDAVKKIVSDYLISNTFGLQNLLKRNVNEFQDFFETAKQVIKIKYSYKGTKYTDFFDNIFKQHHKELEQFFAQQVIQLAQEQQRQYEVQQNYQNQLQAQQNLQQQLQLQQLQQIQLQQNNSINLGNYGALNQISMNQTLPMAKEQQQTFNSQQQQQQPQQLNNQTFNLSNNNINNQNNSLLAFSNMNNNYSQAQQQQQQQISFEKIGYQPQISSKQLSFMDESQGQRRRQNISNEG